MLDKPDFTMLRVDFEQAGEQILAEASAMVARSTEIDMQTQMQGGMFAAAKRKMLGGESLFQNTFTATQPGQSMYLAPGPEGDLDVFHMDGNQPVFLSSGAFLASAPSVELDSQWGGARGLFSGQGLFLLRCDGTGPLFFCCYGGLHTVDVGPEGYVCDTGHIVGFTGGLDYDVQRVGGIKSTLFSGEGLIARFRGQGRLWMSTRRADALVHFLQPFRRVERSNN
jgi:uncharacterized protein (TIGR00266 family)